MSTRRSDQSRGGHGRKGILGPVGRCGVIDEAQAAPSRDTVSLRAGCRRWGGSSCPRRGSETGKGPASRRKVMAERRFFNSPEWRLSSAHVACNDILPHVYSCSPPTSGAAPLNSASIKDWRKFLLWAVSARGSHSSALILPLRRT